MATQLTTHHPPTRSQGLTQARLRSAAAIVAALIAGVYGLVFAGVLSVGRAEQGDLAILGVAGAVFAVLALLLWRVSSRLLWAGVGLLQLLLTAMYIAVSPERDPSFEVWGLTIRGLSLALLVIVVALLVGARRR
jgi:hypothetical protein